MTTPWRRATMDGVKHGMVVRIPATMTRQARTKHHNSPTAVPPDPVTSFVIGVLKLELDFVEKLIAHSHMLSCESSGSDSDADYPCPVSSMRGRGNKCISIYEAGAAYGVYDESA